MPPKRVASASNADAKKNKKQKTSNDQTPDQQVDIYLSQPSKFRRFELVIENKSIFVNAHTLADLSPFFESLCFAKDSEQQKASIKDETYADMLELFSCLLPSDNGPPKLINVTNFALIARLADKYQVKALSKACELFVESDQFDYTKIEEPHLLALLRATVTFRLSKDAMVKLLQRAATIPLKTLKEQQSWLPSKVSAALFAAAKKWNRQRPIASVDGNHELEIVNDSYYPSKQLDEDSSGKDEEDEEEEDNHPNAYLGDCEFCGEPTIYACKFCMEWCCEDDSCAINVCDKSPLPVVHIKCPVGVIDVSSL